MTGLVQTDAIALVAYSLPLANSPPVRIVGEEGDHDEHEQYTTSLHGCPRPRLHE
jgi:hypothetical protein